MPTLTPTTSIAQLQPAPRALAGSVSTPALPRPKQPSSRPSSSRPTSSSRSRVKLYSPVQPPLVPSVSTATLKHFSCDLDEAALSGIFRRGTPAPPCASIRSADLQKFTRVSRFELDPTKLLDVALREASRVSLDARLQAENLSRDVNDPILPANSAARHAARTLVGRGLKVSQRLLASLERLTIAASDSAVTLGARLASTTEQLGTGFAAFSRELQAVEAEQAAEAARHRAQEAAMAAEGQAIIDTLSKQLAAALADAEAQRRRADEAEATERARAATEAEAERRRYRALHEEIQHDVAAVARAVGAGQPARASLADPKRSKLAPLIAAVDERLRADEEMRERMRREAAARGADADAREAACDKLQAKHEAALIALQQTHEKDTAQLRMELQEFLDVHEAALEAGTIKGRQILYIHSLTRAKRIERGQHAPASYYCWHKEDAIPDPVAWREGLAWSAVAHAGLHSSTSDLQLVQMAELAGLADSRPGSRPESRLGLHGAEEGAE